MQNLKTKVRLRALTIHMGTDANSDDGEETNILVMVAG